jgi:hypothetical protein
MAKGINCQYVGQAVVVLFNGGNLGQINLVGSGFYYLEVDPGRNDITASQIALNPNTATLSVTCIENEHYFVHVDINGAKSSAALLELVDNAKGRKKDHSPVITLGLKHQI